MADGPDAWMDRLWLQLGLGPRRAGEVGVLTVDGISVRLAGTTSGRAIRVEADVGLLPLDPAVRERVVRTLLAVNLGLLTRSEAGIALADAGAGRRVIRAVAVWPLGAGGLDGLQRAVEDVLQRVEMHRGDLPATTAPRPVDRPRSEPAADEPLIFRP